MIPHLQAAVSVVLQHEVVFFREAEDDGGDDAESNFSVHGVVSQDLEHFDTFSHIGAALVHGVFRVKFVWLLQLVSYDLVDDEALLSVVW